MKRSTPEMAATDRRSSDSGADSGTTLEQMLGEGHLERDAHQVDRARSVLQVFIEETTGVGASVDRDAKRAVIERIAALHRLVSVLTSRALRHEKYQKIEANWRNLDKLVSEYELSSSAKVRVLNCRRTESTRGLLRAAGFDRLHLLEHVNGYATLGGLSYPIRIGDTELDRSPMDLELQHDTVSMTYAPILASADPPLFDLDSIANLDRLTDRHCKDLRVERVRSVEFPVRQRRLAPRHESSGLVGWRDIIVPGSRPRC